MGLHFGDLTTPMSDSAEPEHPPLPDSEGGSPDGGIPEEPEGSPLLSAEEAEDGSRTPMADLPALDFWEALYLSLIHI